MKLTLDHNVIIDLAHGCANVARLREILVANEHEAYVVEMGASEMRKMGVRPDRYDLFEELLKQAGVESLPRLTPMMIWDVTFWDHGLWADESMVELATQVERILFGQSESIDIAAERQDSSKYAVWLNRLCDVHTMWCHLHYKNEMFVTSDRNFHKSSKRPPLVSLGAGQIRRPELL